MILYYLKDTDGELIRALNGVEGFMKNNTKQTFDPKFVEKFTKCLERFDPKLLKSVDAQWKGFQTYSTTDNWKQCKPGDNGTQKVNYYI